MQASINCSYLVSHSGYNMLEMSFKDDLESLGYVLVNMITGTLPWRDLISTNIKEDLYD